MILALLSASISGYSQNNPISNESLVLTGIIWDAETFQPVPYANVYTSRQGTFTNLKGEYRIKIQKDDTLNVSHISYQAQKSVFSGNVENQFFWLKPLTTTLSEVVVSPLPSEQDMKSIILQTQTEEPQILMRGRRNLKTIQNMYLGGYKPEMNSADNYLNYLRGPQDVSLFSTSPTRGIGSVIRNLRKNR